MNTYRVTLADDSGEEVVAIVAARSSFEARDKAQDAMPSLRIVHVESVRLEVAS